jgi:hypothetical protein
LQSEKSIAYENWQLEGFVDAQFPDVFAIAAPVVPRFPDTLHVLRLDITGSDSLKMQSSLILVFFSKLAAIHRRVH